jgi:hypothetical protein
VAEEVSLNLTPHSATDVGLANLVVVVGLGWEDVESSGVWHKADHQMDAYQAGHKEAHRTRSHIGAGHNHLGGLASGSLGRDEAEVRKHNRVDVRHQCEGIQQEVEVAWYMVKHQPWEIE